MPNTQRCCLKDVQQPDLSGASDVVLKVGLVQPSQRLTSCADRLLTILLCTASFLYRSGVLAPESQPFQLAFIVYRGNVYNIVCEWDVQA